MACGHRVRLCFGILLEPAGVWHPLKSGPAVIFISDIFLPLVLRSDASGRCLTPDVFNLCGTNVKILLNHTSSATPFALSSPPTGHGIKEKDKHASEVQLLTYTYVFFSLSSSFKTGDTLESPNIWS